ncbi:MAG: sigma-70 family RNA polymerase sigma factor [Candidatus Eremiobacteraeota bacterium]|nr:sigma-70 family RNA polymerase sigma factor [Candidatus Eremiobacteraeota bacterium]
MPQVQRKPLGPEQQQRAERDLRLLQEYRAGRPDAFDDLVHAYQPTVQRVLMQLNVAPTDVEDLAQEVFMRVYRNLHRFREQSSFYTWLYRITVNVFFDHNKKRKRADVRLQRLQSAMVDVSNTRPEADDPFRAAFERLTTDTFSRAIAMLPEPFRDVVAMREVDDLSYEEIALQTGISIGTVRSRLSRARARLKDVLRPQLGVVAAA